MRSFKPAMKDGMGAAAKMHPDAVHEWNDVSGKHKTSGLSVPGAGGEGAGAPVLKSKARNRFDSMGGTHQSPQAGHESAQSKKSHGEGRGTAAFPSYSGSGGHPTGPMKHAGKGEFEGRTKSPGGAGKLNRGNGVTSGSRDSVRSAANIINGTKIRGSYC